MSMKKIVSGMMVISLMLSASEALAALEKVGVVGLAGKDLAALDAEGKNRNLKTGDDIFLNDEVTSGADKAQLIFLDRSTLTVNPGSKVKVDTFVYDPAASTGKLAFSNFKGAVRFVGGKLSKKQPVTMKTPVATIGIRGGILDTHVTDSGATDSIFVFGDEMTMTNADGKMVSTTERGTGFNLATPNGLPTALPPEVVQQHLNQFEPVGGAMEGAPSSEDVDEGMDSVSATTESSAANSGGNNSNSGGAAASGEASTTANAGDSTGENTGGPAASGEKVPDAIVATVDGLGGAGIETTPVSNVGQDQFNNTLQQEVQQAVTGTGTPSTGNTILSTANLNTLNTAINDARVNQNLPPLPGTGGAVIAPPVEPAPLPQPIVENSSSSSSSSSSTSSSSSSTSSGGAALRGRYFNYEDSFDVGGGTHDGDYVDPNEVKTGNITGSVNGTNYSITNTPVSSSGGAETKNIPTALFTTGKNPLIEAEFDPATPSDISKFEKGITYTTTGGSMRYFHFLDNTSDGEVDWYKNEVIGVIGTGVAPGTFGQAVTAAAANASATNGIVFYDFLPELSDRGNTMNTNDWGALDWNIVNNDTSFLQDVTGSNIQLPAGTDFGMAVDYQNKKFISGYLSFVDEMAATYGDDSRPSATLLFGNVETAGVGGVNTADGLPYLNGVYLQYKGVDPSIATGAPNSGGGRYGQARVGQNIFSTKDGSGNNDKIEGMVVNLGYADSAASAGQLFNGSYVPGNHYFEQVITIDNAPTTPTTDQVAAAERTAGTYKGFASGLMIANPGSTASASLYQSQNPDMVELMVGGVDGTSNVNGEVGASFNLINLNEGGIGLDASGGTAYGVSFGKVGPADSSPGANAYLSNKLYAAQMKGMGAANADDSKGAFLASGGALMHNAPQCSQCTYTHWGVWAGEFNAGGTQKTPNMIPYLVGRDITQFANLPAAGYNNVVYNGQAYGNFSRQDGANLYVSNEVGAFNADFDLGNRKVNSMTMDFANVKAYNNQQLTIDVGTANKLSDGPPPVYANPLTGAITALGTNAAINVGQMDVGVTLDGTKITTYDTTQDALINGIAADTNIKGAFYGNTPGSVAREVGGNFAVGFTDGGQTYQAGGVYHGHTTTNVTP